MQRRICVYESGETDFAGNGLGTISPTECTVHWSENGEYSVELTHPIDEDAVIPKYGRVCQTDRVLVVPVPEAPSMRLRKMEKQVAVTVTIETWAVATRRSRLRLRGGPGTNYACLGYYEKDSRVTLIAKTNPSWFEVTAPDGKHGWMSANYLSYVSSRTITRPERRESAEILRDMPMRAQPFDIYAVDPDVRSVSVRARHVFWRLAENVVCGLRIDNMTAQQALNAAFAAAENQDHGFNWYCEDTEAMSLEDEISGKTLVDVILGDKGICETYGLKLLVDWFDVFLVREIGEDRGVQLRYAKNLAGMSGGFSVDQVVTRVIPVGQTQDGKPLYRSGQRYLQSPNESLYARPRYGVLRVDNAKIGGDMSEAQARAELDRAAQEQLDGGCDLPECSINVEMAPLRNDPSWRDYAALERVCPGDTLALFVPAFALALSVRVSEYEFDALSQQYTDLVIGSPRQNLSNSGVTSRQLGKGSVTASKLAMNAVDSSALRDDVIAARHVQADSIGTDHLQAHSVTADILAANAVNAQAIQAVTAHIGDLEAENLTADDLVAAVGHMLTLIAEQIDTGHIDAGLITGQTAELAEVIAGNGVFDFATVQHLVSRAMNLERGTADQVFIRNLAVAYAQIVSATIGELCIRASDGGYYLLDVDTAHGTVTATPTQVSEDERAAGHTSGGKTILDTDITAENLNAANIFATYALVNQIDAARIDVDQLFAREAFIRRLDTAWITSESALTIISRLSGAESAAEGAQAEITNMDRQLKLWFRFDSDRGLVVQKMDENGNPASIWYTVTDEVGYHIGRTDLRDYVFSAYRDRVWVQNLEIGDIVVKPSGKGGWVWSGR